MFIWDLIFNIVGSIFNFGIAIIGWTASTVLELIYFMATALDPFGIIEFLFGDDFKKK